MVTYSWWLALATAPLAAQACILPVYSYWVSYAKTKNIFSDAADLSNKPAALNYSQIKGSSVVLLGTVATAFILAASANPQRGLVVGQPELLAVAATASLLTLFNSTLVKAHSPRNVNSIELINFVLFCALSSFLLLTASNMLVAFFALELLGSVTLYAFFVFGGYALSSSAQQSISAVSSCTYQFILNFFGSVIFYAALSVLAYYHGSNTLSGAHARMAGGWALWAQTASAGALLVKLGTGPWIFYKLSIYKGITVQAAAVYTFVYFGAVLVFTLNLLTGSALSVAHFFGPACVLLFAVCALLFGAGVFQTNTTTLFLSFSSMLNLIFIVLQLA